MSLIDRAEISEDAQEVDEDFSIVDYADEAPHAKPSGWKEYLIARYGPLPFADGFPDKREIPRLLLNELKENWRSGTSVALVSLPLSISLAVAADATPNMGMITASWAGLIHSLFGGCQYNIVGPTGALSGILSMYAIRYGIEVIPFLGLLSAILATIVWLIRLDKFLVFIPSSVVHGFTVGVALIIFLNQLGYAFGLTGLEPKEEFYLNIVEIFRHIHATNPWSVVVCFVGAVSLFLLGKKIPVVPWTIVHAGFGTLFGWLIYAGHIPMGQYRMLTLRDKFGEISPNLFSVMTIRAEWFHLSNLAGMLMAAFNIMFIVILETLISARVADELTHTRYVQSWEVVAVTAANYVCSFFGGVPATAALARTAFNIKCGATSRTSGVLNSIWLFLISYALLKLFQFLLLPVVGAIVMVVAIKMVEWEPLINMWKHDKGGFFIMILTMLICLFWNPTFGLIAGALFALLRMAIFVAGLKHESTVTLDGVKLFVPLTIKKKSRASSKQHREGDVLLFTIPGDFTYLNAGSYVTRATHIQNKFRVVVISLSHLGYIDMDGVDSFTEIVEHFEKDGVTILIAGITPGTEQYQTLIRTKWFQELVDARRVFATHKEAVHFLHEGGGVNMESTPLKETIFDHYQSTGAKGTYQSTGTRLEDQIIELTDFNKK
eukprot:TRINITY_DN9685_c0_g2_i2.p1 TRINITY_DN9685_c0_g2~~TRINITY_DN9685_c0_g2_i2.p1  ORF type:complete len:663 (+),score=126.30 TRINITY_DN9685_c0_g2_i2:97-2085(+)